LSSADVETISFAPSARISAGQGVSHFLLN